MTIRAIAGLAVLNILFLGVGSGILWGIRGWRSWSELGRLIGVAYLLGVASLSIVLTCALVVGVPFGPLMVLACGAGIVGAGVILGRTRGHSLPRFRLSGSSLPILSAPTALFVAVLALYFEAFFRAARLAAPHEWDAWWVWTIRAKALYHGGDLGGAALVHDGYSIYPPALSLIHATGFEAMRSTDTVTLHLQHWFLALGFAAALIGVLSDRCRPIVFLPFVIVVLTMPIFLEWATILYADLLVAFQASIALLLLSLWLEDKATWRIGAATILLGGALLTKREGVVVAVCILGACLIASWRDRRQSWPWLCGAIVGAVALSLPWWALSEQVGEAAPSTGFLGFFGTIDRVWPSFKLTADVFLDFWVSSGMAILVIAIALGMLVGARRFGTLIVSFAGLSIIGTTALIASEPLLEFSRNPEDNPVERLVMVSFVVLIPLAPLLVEQLLRYSSQEGSPTTDIDARARRRPGWKLAVPWAIVVAALVGYPALMLTGASGLPFPGGPPSFPSAAECPVGQTGRDLVPGRQIPQPIDADCRSARRPSVASGSTPTVALGSESAVTARDRASG